MKTLICKFLPQVRRLKKWLKYNAIARMAAALLTTIILAAASPSFAGDNPFADGTRTVVLSHEERASLLQFADNSKAKLEKALRIADG